MGIEMLTHRIGCSYKSLSNNLAPEKAFSARNPVMCPSVREKNMVFFVSVEGASILAATIYIYSQKVK